MNELFERIYGDKRVMREWLGHLIMYSMMITLSGLYVNYFTLGQGLLQMIGSIYGVTMEPKDLEEIKRGMMTMPAHSDVVEGLQHLKKLGSTSDTYLKLLPHTITGWTNETQTTGQEKARTM